jgi:L-ornithine N5-oxygenase
MPYTNNATRHDTDILGVGFGPSNLALAIAIHEQELKTDGLQPVFLEQKARFGWHRGMLLDDAKMQIMFLKDLATLRNPISKFGFLYYLHEKRRLLDFINHKTLFPSRLEFHDYLEWAAAHFENVVDYDTVATDIRPVSRNGEVLYWDVIAARGGVAAHHVTYRTRNVILATGITPALPDDIELSERVWHSATLLQSLAAISWQPKRFAVVGAGQSAAETTAYLHKTFPDAEVYAILSRYGYSPADDTPYSNQIFDPDAVDEYFAAPGPVKELFYQYHSNTNYSVVDEELIAELYRRAYLETFSRKRLHLLHMSEVFKLEPSPGAAKLQVRFLPTGEVTEVEADAVVYATGYAPMDPLKLLGCAADLCVRDDAGRLQVERDYRLKMVPGVKSGVYLQGGTEYSHGLSSSLLSNAAVRAADIVRSIAVRANPLPSGDTAAPINQERS